MEKILLISPSTLDRKSLIMTLIFCVVPTLLFGWLFYRNLATNHVLALIMGGTLALFLLIFVLGFIITPYKFILTNYELIIKRHFKDIVIPLEDINLIRLMSPDDKKGLIRTFGADGCFGSWGYYQTSIHKKLQVYTRRYNNWTLIITNGKKYVIAPDDLKLIDATMQQIGQTQADHQAIDAPSKHWRKWITAAIVAVVIFLVYMGFKEPRFVSDSNAFKLKGLYGVNIPFAEMSEADTITWREMPAISIRTNGISLFKVHRGSFRTTDGKKIRLSVNRGSSPIIRMMNRDGAVYYINRKNATETRKIFNELKGKIKK